MKLRVFLILILSLTSLSSAFSQDEVDDEFFEDEEAIVDPADEFIPPANPNDTNPRRPLPRQSGGFNGNSGGPSNTAAGGGMGTTPEGEVQFRLVDPPAFKKPKTPTRIPLAIRKKVEERLKQSDKE